LIALEIRFVGAGFITVTGNDPTTARSAVLIVAVNFTELTKVVGRGLPFHLTTDPLTKPAPMTVRGKPGSPTIAFSGIRLLIAGVTDMLTAFEVRFVVFKTVIGNVPTVTRSVPRIDAVSWVALIKVVERLTPLKRTTEPAAKPVPLTVSPNPRLPALLVGGEIVLIVGGGAPVGLTLRLTAELVPPPGVGLKTVIGNVPVTAISAAVIDAVNCVLVTNVVGRGLPLSLTSELPV
jgi:hypothetical protein